VNSITACDRLIASTLPCKSCVLSFRIPDAVLSDELSHDMGFSFRLSAAFQERPWRSVRGRLKCWAGSAGHWLDAVTILCAPVEAAAAVFTQPPLLQPG
jgi:hypothetical protein